MAAFTPEDPADRHAFLDHMSRVREDPSAVQRVNEAEGTISGFGTVPAGAASRL